MNDNEDKKDLGEEKAQDLEGTYDNRGEDVQEEELSETEQRKFGRRTLRDRRRPWGNQNRKGSDRRYHKRRSGKDRRKDEQTEDDLGKHIP